MKLPVPARIMYLVAQLQPGGQERQLVNLLQALGPARCSPSVAVWNYSEHDAHVAGLRSLGVPVYSLADGTNRLARILRCRRLARQLGSDVVHSYSFYTNFIAWLATIGTGRVPIGSIRSSLREAMRESGALLGALCARWPRYQVSNSQSAAREAEGMPAALRPTSVSVVWNGIDSSRFRADSPPDRTPPRIIGIGSLMPVKRWELVIAAAEILRDRGFEFRLELAGEGPLRHQLAEEVRARSLAERVRLLGQVSDVPRLVAASTLLVHSSRVEGCPNSVLEAMAGARAVVACRAGDIGRIVEDGVTGFLTEPGDALGLADAIGRLLDDRALCRRMGRAGREKVEREFGLDRLASETLAAYRLAGWQEA